MAKEGEPQVQDITLDDIYDSFSKKKLQYAIRLKNAFLEHNIETFDDLMALSMYDIINMEGIGGATLKMLILKLNSMGIDYFPVKNEEYNKLNL